MIAWGGLHGAINNYRETSDEKRIIVNYDVRSYYPSLMIENKYLSRNVANPDIFSETYKKRIEAKKRTILKYRRL